MHFKMRYYFTGADHKRYLCQLRQVGETEGIKLFYFLCEASGDMLIIKKIQGTWRYHDGATYYRESWIEELGEQVDSGNFH